MASFIGNARNRPPPRGTLNRNHPACNRARRCLRAGPERLSFKESVARVQWIPIQEFQPRVQTQRRQNMAGNDKSLFNRRQLARSAMLGGATAFLGAGALAAPAVPTGRNLIDAREFGAAGDGKTDDTAALQRALDAAAPSSGAVF